MHWEYRSKSTHNPEMDRVLDYLDSVYNRSKDNLGDYQMAAALVAEFGISAKQALPYVSTWRENTGIHIPKV